MRARGAFPNSPSNQALAECRHRLRAAAAILSRANVVLHDTVEARDQAIAELRAADHAQDRFVIAAAHELTSPLTAVKGHAQLLRLRARSGSLVAGELDAGLGEIDAAADKLAAQLATLVAAIDASPWDADPDPDGLTDRERPSR